MLQLSYLREHKQRVVDRLAVKNFDAEEIVAKILVIDTERRMIQLELETVLSESNKLAKQIGELMRSGKKTEADEIKNQTMIGEPRTQSAEPSPINKLPGFAF